MVQARFVCRVWVRWRLSVCLLGYVPLRASDVNRMIELAERNAMKYKVKLPWESANEVTVAYLKDTIAELKANQRARKEGHPLGIFEKDKDEDLKEIKRHITSFKTVLSYLNG